MSESNNTNPNTLKTAEAPVTISKTKTDNHPEPSGTTSKDPEPVKDSLKTSKVKKAKDPKEVLLGTVETPIENYPGDTQEFLANVMSEVIGKALREGKVKIVTVKDKGLATTNLIITV